MDAPRFRRTECGEPCGGVRAATEKKPHLESNHPQVEQQNCRLAGTVRLTSAAKVAPVPKNPLMEVALRQSIHGLLAVAPLSIAGKMLYAYVFFGNGEFD